jgi:peroxiredoxin 2/4
MQPAGEPQPAEPILRVNEPAPDFEATTTHGPRKLADYRGKWLLLFSVQADFRPACATEFLAFAHHYEAFQKLNCELLALSVDSVGSHLAWVFNIKEKFGVTLPFPIIADSARKVASAYHMIVRLPTGERSVGRTTYLIDDKSVLRAMMHNPVRVGRSVAEILRLLEAVQTVDTHNVATPEGWQPGDKVILPPPKTIEDAASRQEKGFECVDWYFCKKEV